MKDVKILKCGKHDEYTAKSQFLTHFTGRLLNNLDLTQILTQMVIRN